MLRSGYLDGYSMANPYPQHGLSKRRSTRVAANVLLRVKGNDGNGHPFTERTGTLEVSFQGCKYFSKYALPVNSRLSLEIANDKEDSTSRWLLARVAWARKSRNLPGLFQVGVEFETPGNIWGLVNPPGDWQQLDVRKVGNVAAFEREMKELLTIAETGTYYQLLRIDSGSPHAKVRQNYYELVRKFHPDRHMDHAEWMKTLHKLTETATLAYETITDETARQKYDEQLAASGAFSLGRHRSESQKTAEECIEKARECSKAHNLGGSILWLRKATEIAPQSHEYHALLGRALSGVVPLRREAVEHFEKALELDASRSAVRLQLANLYQEMKLPWRARLHCQKVLEIDPNNTKAQERLRLLDSESGKNGVRKRSFLDRIFR